jgi:TPR repeat protein
MSVASVLTFRAPWGAVALGAALVITQFVLPGVPSGAALAAAGTSTACAAEVEKIRLWVRATDPQAPAEERAKVTAAVDHAHAVCAAAREAAPKEGDILISGAYTLFAKGDKKAGVKLIEQAAELGHPPAMVMMAQFLGTGDTVEKDAEAAWLLLLNTLKSDHSSARVKAALEFLPGGTGPENPKRAAKALRKMINAGNGEAMIAYAMSVLSLPKAKPGSEQAKEGLALLKRAAVEAKDASAMITLSLLYNQGNMIERNEAKAVEFAQMALDMGIIQAYGTMGQIYQNQNDLTRAAEWFQRGAEAGDGFSQGMLGFLLSGGFGIEQDIDKAVEWWTKGRWNGDRISSSYLQVHRDKQAAEKAWEEEEKAKAAAKPKKTE